MADTKSIVPTITPAEALRAATALAQRAKARFLEGAPEEAASLADHAAKLCSTLDAEASGLLSSLAKNFRAYLSGTGTAAIAKPAAPPQQVPPPAAVIEPPAA